MSSVLSPNQSLGTNQAIFSPSNTFELIMQGDGNLVLYRRSTGHALWATGTNGKDVMRAIMQTDGNLVLYLFNGKAAWASNTNGNPNSYLAVQDDGNLVIYKPTVPIWATNTVGQ
jgi:hypothetical protein